MAYIATPKLEAALRGEGDLIKLAQEALENAADPALIQSARDEYGSDEIEIDDDAATSESDEGTWVSAWVWIANPLEEEG